MMAWHIASTLDVLRAQVDKAMPHRSKASDGVIGDARHQAEHSDHNPNGAGVVCAWDCTATPSNPIWQKLADDMVEDSRTNYVIFNKRIRKHGEAHWHPYSGADSHTNHIHLSIRQSPVAWNSKRAWVLKRFAPAPVAAKPKPVPVTPTATPVPNRMVWGFPTAYIRLNPSTASRVEEVVHKGDKLVAVPGGTVLWARIDKRGYILRTRIKNI